MSELWLVFGQFATLTPPRLLTGKESTAISPGESGASTWLLVGALLACTLTLMWWGWWFIRYRNARFTESERAYRRLCRVLGLGVSDREWLRKRCVAAGMSPVACIASPGVAAEVLNVAEVNDRRALRLRRLLCDTDIHLDGTNGAAHTHHAA